MEQSKIIDTLETYQRGADAGWSSSGHAEPSADSDDARGHLRAMQGAGGNRAGRGWLEVAGAGGRRTDAFAPSLPACTLSRAS